MKLHIGRTFVCVLLLASAARSDVHVVGGRGDFWDLQSAVDAAADGDTLLVRAGSYSGFLLTGKGLSIVADLGAEPYVSADVRLQSIPAGRTVVIAGLRVTPTYNTKMTKYHALVVDDVDAAVRVSDCTFVGADNSHPNFVGGAGGSGIVISNSTDVVLTRCVAVGGRGNEVYDCCNQGGYGGEGLDLTESTVALYDCQLTGGLGGYSGQGGDGGRGAYVSGSGLFASGCTFTGGKGGHGDDFLCGPGGKGGAGLRIGAASQAYLRDNLYVGGAGGDSSYFDSGACGPGSDALGLQALAGSTVVQFPGAARRFAVQHVGWKGSLVRVTVEGEPGDRVWFPSSPKTGFRLSPALAGVWAIYFPVYMPIKPLGVVPASGTLELIVPIPDLPGEGDLRHFQGYAISAGGQSFAGTPTSLAQLDCAFSSDCDQNGLPDACEIQSGATSDCNDNGLPDSCDVAAGTLPDCNFNGIVDFCDILSGASSDCDQDGVPDECQVDCNGNGVADPCDVQAGTSLDCDADLIPDECQIDCNGNGIADACDIAQGTSSDSNGNGVPDECQSPADVYHVDLDGSPFGGDGSPGNPFDTLAKAMAYAIDGNTILVADGTYTGPENRGLAFGGRDLTIVGQNGAANVVIDCQDAERAFVFDAGTTLAARLEGLTIRNGAAFAAALENDRGGGVLVQSGGGATIVGCVIEQCDGREGGGVYVASDADAVLSGSALTGNNAPLLGGGGGGLSSNSLGSMPSTGTLVLEDCLVADNVGGQGAGLAIASGYARVVDCVVTGNHKPTSGSGGGLYHKGIGTIEIVRTRLSGNTGAGGAAGIYSESHGSVRISHCVVAGNVSTSLGGGIGVRNFGQPILTATIDNCLIAGNVGTTGGGIRASGVLGLVVRDCTIADNRSTQGGGMAVTSNVVSTVLRNCIVWGNQASSAGPSLMAYSGVNVDSCDVQGGLNGTATGLGGSYAWGPSNIELDPLFADGDGPDGDPFTWQDNDYRLGPLSPCADAGDNGAVGADSFDLDGDLDTFESIPLDLYLTPRFEDDPAVPDTGIGAAPIVDLGAFERP